MNKRAKEIQARTGCSYKAAQKKAGAEMRGAKVSGTPKRRKKKVGAKYKVYHEVKRIGTAKRKPGGTVGSIAHTKSHLKKQLEEKLAWQLLARESATRVRDRKKKTKLITETKKELRAIGGLKRR